MDSPHCATSEIHVSQNQTVRCRGDPAEVLHAIIVPPIVGIHLRSDITTAPARRQSPVLVLCV